MEDPAQCRYDYLEVSYLRRGEGTVHLDRMCGPSDTGILVMEGVANAAMLTFRSDGDTKERGFLISYRGVR